MKKIVPLSLAIACLNFELYASTWKCYTNEQGEVRHLFVPSEDNIQRVAMVPVRDDIEIAVPEGAELAGYPAEKSSAIRSELVRYALRPYMYDFGENDLWGCLIHVSRHGAGKRLPVIVYMPGLGEISPDLSRQFRQRRLFDKVTSEAFQKKHPCHLIALSPPDNIDNFCSTIPGVPNRTLRKTMSMVKGACEKITSRLVDYSRIYVVGLSFGGDVASMLNIVYPNFFAASVSIASCPVQPEFFPEDNPGAYWTILNEFDPLANEVCRYAQMFNRNIVIERGGDFRISIYPGVYGHNAWDAAWKDEEVWTWLFSKAIIPSRKAYASSGVPSTDYSEPVLLDEAVCESTVKPIDDVHNASKAADYLDNTYFEPAQAFGKNDWWQMKLSKPMTGKVRICTGKNDGTLIMKSGYAEYSADGKSWKRGGNISKTSGNCEFRTQKPFMYIRIRSSKANHEPFVIRTVSVAIYFEQREQ